MIVDEIRYYLLGGQAIAFGARGMPVPSFSLSLLWADIGTNILILATLVVISAISGIVASFLPARD